MDAREAINLILGKRLQEAQAILKESRFVLRVLSIDGEQFMGDCQFDDSRITVDLKDNLVVRAVVG